ncbi:Ig-like domain-containing protein [Flavisericum labens]|uniref:Ig-like domain-containing protein n=1 Tax=Flavisericum labens TaxID=3377112 RepID=UPI00387B7073
MKKSYIAFLLLFPLIFSNCKGEDILDDEVPREVRILNPIQNLSISATHQYNASYFNNVGQQESIDIDWSSSNENVATINSQGLVNALAEGQTTVKAMVMVNSSIVENSTVLNVIMNDDAPTSNSKSGDIATTSSYELSGSFMLTEIENTNNLLLSISEDYTASTSLPGLYLYLTNNPSSVANALSLGPVEVFSGAHNYTIENVGINDYSYLLYWCEPFSVKVGGGDIE